MTPGFADSPPWRPTVITLGVLTMLLAGWRAVREYDLKLILAFGTVSQLGLITVMVGAGGSDMMLAGLAMLCAHAMFKAALFMVVGVIDHATGTRDIRRLAWLGRRAAGACSSSPSAPRRAWRRCRRSSASSPRRPTSKPCCTARRWARRHRSCSRASCSVRCSPPSTACASCVGAFGRKGRPEPSTRVAEMHRPEVTFMLPPALLAAAGLLFGLWPTQLDIVLDNYADTVPGGEDYDLALWHGLGLPLLLSVLVLAVGTAAFFGRSRLRRLRTVREPLGNADRIYDAAVRGLDLLSVRLTAVTQRGSIPATQSVILSTLVLVPTVVLAIGARDRPDFALWGSPLQVVVGLHHAGGRARRDRDAQPAGGRAAGRRDRLRLRRDLRVPRRTRSGADPVPGRDADAGHLRAGVAHAARRGRPHRTSIGIGWPRAALALAVGATVTTLAAYAMAARTGTPIAALLPDAAYYRGHGANTVNVLLVDIRAWDTMGEIMVLLVAATGVASMVFRHRRFGAAPRVSDAGQPDIGRLPVTSHSPAVGDVTWLRGSELRDPRHRSLVLEVATRHHLPAHHGAVGVLLLRRTQHPRRRFRGWTDRGSRAGAALSRGRSLRTR